MEKKDTYYITVNVRKVKKPKSGKLEHFANCCETNVKSNQQSVNEVKNN